ncbi:hypothetical protein HanXRQr2_Chr10g0427701 [Helianthus annuus]|uniref:Uncharacterized protein n=1 Tax=Helianthus annuus TaxID=4232 RepID=A0A9K3HWC2_HELAN|nr:hypothetical protein HanXRQr2_Chr10g0427701 [Helianthus annuus]KAJ0512926.1 hypothetical protein HanHA300_Chr10g0351651 [Helianthus annuus]KAJ0529049.1 hypothetical protein HanHA89_Chr10g0373331 [Helianthus annuus]
MKRAMTNCGGCSQLGFGYRAPDSCSDSRFFFWFRLRLSLGFNFSWCGSGNQPRQTSVSVNSRFGFGLGSGYELGMVQQVRVQAPSRQDKLVNGSVRSR